MRTFHKYTSLTYLHQTKLFTHRSCYQDDSIVYNSKTRLHFSCDIDTFSKFHVSDVWYFTPVILKVILAVMYFSGLRACLLSVTRALDGWEFCSNDRVVKSVSSTHFIAEERKHVLTLLHMHSSAETLEFLLQDEIVWIGIELTLEICLFLTGHQVNKAIAKEFYGGKGGIPKLFP